MLTDGARIGSGIALVVACCGSRLLFMKTSMDGRSGTNTGILICSVIPMKNKWRVPFDSRSAAIGLEYLSLSWHASINRLIQVRDDSVTPFCDNASAMRRHFA
jgi:hypothetical protein